ncbi:MAG: hypothetical protein JW827_10585 [Spirochaetes bacterium]|nr:hypothetical protein [Spirochaetota bacterium]
MRLAIIFMLLFSFIVACAPINDTVIFNNQWEEEKAIETKSTGTKLSFQGQLMIDDFNIKNKNNLKGDVNPWDFKPEDDSQICRIRYNRQNKMGNKGFAIQIDYDVDSPNQAFNGFYSDLRGIDASGYNKVIFYVKGNKDKGFTSVFKVELKNNSGQTGYAYVRGVSDQWQKIVIALDDFKGLSDLSSMKEFTVVFVDSEVTEKVGTLYMENLYFSK